MNTVAKLSKALLAFVLATLSACDSAGQGAVEPAGEPERRAAHGLIGQIMAIAEQPGDAARLLQASDFTPLLSLVTSSPSSLPTPLVTRKLAALPSNALAGCLLAAGTAATLTECELGDHAIDGTWSMQHQRVHAELVDVFVVGDGGHRGSLWIDANLSAAGAPLADGTAAGDMATLLGAAVPVEGSIEVSLMWTTAGQDHALDASLRIEGLVVEGPACATAGTITISGRLTDAANTTTTLWFGPTCRDIHLSRHASR